jgi:hypothetical protein
MKFRRETDCLSERCDQLRGVVTVTVHHTARPYAL